MAAPIKNASASKDKPKPYHYATRIQPTDDVVEFFVEHMTSCDVYASDYGSCKSFGGRVNQYFVYGKELDCEHYKHVMTACDNFLESGEKEYKDYIVQYEKAKRDFRVTNATANNVWEYRTTPNAEWNKPLNRVSLDEIRSEDECIAARLNMNQNNADIPSENLRENTETVKDSNFNENSNNKGGNSSDSSDETGGKNITNEKVNASNSKKGWCAVS